MKTAKALFPLLLLLVSCGDEDPLGPGSYTVGDFTVVVGDGSLEVRRGADGALLLRSDAKLGAAGDAKKPPGLVGWREATVDIKTAYGMSIFDETAPDWQAASSVKVVSADGGKLSLSAGGGTITLSSHNSGVLAVSVVGSKATDNRAVQSFACGSSDRFFGLGAMVHGTEHRGEIIPTWTSEQGIGKVRRKFLSDQFPLRGDIHDSYFPIPFVMHSAGFGVLVQNTHRSLFNLCHKDNANRWALETWNGTLKYLLVDGPALTTVLERLTKETGRPRLLPKWALAPWIDIIHGSKAVLDGAKTLRKAKIPSSAVWSEDWIGGESKSGGYHLKYKWTEDKTLYPDLKGLIGTLHGMGFRFLGYFNQFIDKNYEHWKQGEDNGYLIKDSAGKTVSFAGVFGQPNSLPDFTGKAAADWFKGYAKAAVDMGQDGWMADYGEWLPVEAKMSDGRSGWEAHNDYPVLWHKANREALDVARPDGDYVFFVRSGYTGTGGQAPVVWAGDQQTEFGGYDGMASVIPIMINLGMAGAPVVTHDIGGYSSQGVPHRTKELFYRWTAMGAYSPVMRTHHGADAKDNWQWDQDAATITYFGVMARMHVALFPYRYTLAKEASSKGIPMVRHLMLHYPSDPRVAGIKDQYLLGPSLLVAPVLVDKATSRKVYLPVGDNWRLLSSGGKYAGGREHTIAAALEEIPVFAPDGAVIPYLRGEVDTLDHKATDSTVKGLKAAEEGELGLSLLTGKDGSFAMYDGATFKQTHLGVGTSTPGLELDGKTVPLCSPGVTASCSKVVIGNKMTRVFLDKLQKGTLTGKGRFTLEISGLPTARKVTVDVYY